jgi:hypothetical protein
MPRGEPRVVACRRRRGIEVLGAGLAQHWRIIGEAGADCRQRRFQLLERPNRRRSEIARAATSSRLDLSDKSARVGLQDLRLAAELLGCLHDSTGKLAGMVGEFIGSCNDGGYLPRAGGGIIDILRRFR